MAIETQKPLRDMWSEHIKSAVIKITLIMLVPTVFIGILLYVFSNLSSNIIIFGTIILAIYSLLVFCGLIVIYSTKRPLKDLISLIIYIAGEPTTTTPPNPNDSYYANSSLQNALKVIYALAARKNSVTPDAGSFQDDFLKTALDSSSAGFIVMDHERQIIYNNQSAPLETNTEGKPMIKLIFPETDSINTWLDHCEVASVHEEKIWTRIPTDVPGDECKYYDVIASYNKGSKQEVIITCIDRTSIYKTNEEAFDFISFAAHELRGPITVIRGYLDVFEQELGATLDKDHLELLQRLKVSASRLSGYINNILNTAKYDRRHLKLHLSEESIANIYSSIADDMALRASSQNRILNVSIPTNIPTIAADRASLSEVIGNLVDNAIKYSNEGGIINLNVSTKGESVEISVQDFGIGMPTSVISNLFQKFYRSHRSRETVSGTGIGLYISKAIVESHGGTIGVSSVENEGSTFTVTLPTYQALAPQLATMQNSNEDIIGQGSGWIKNHSMYRG